jgi:hypothetical protein
MLQCTALTLLSCYGRTPFKLVYHASLSAVVVDATAPSTTNCSARVIRKLLARYANTRQELSLSYSSPSNTRALQPEMSELLVLYTEAIRPSANKRR